MRLKNRIIMGPMGTNYGTSDGLATERDSLYYGERARGGVAAIVTEAMSVSPKARNHNKSLCAFHDKFIPSFAGLVSAIHDGGAYAIGQLNHRGGLLKRSVLNMEPVGPSPWANPNTGEPVRALRVGEIGEIQRDFLAAAVRLWRAGYDAVEIHAANGYLFQQFLSPRINRRVDDYGGSLTNRMRLLLETVRMIRAEASEIALLVRLSATEYIEGGYGEDDIVTLARELEALGVCAIDLSGGTNESPELSRFCIQPPSMPRRCLEPYATAFMRALSIPLIVAGRIIDPADAEAVLAHGNADFISIGRGLIADAYWTRKALGDVETPIRACISCNVCFERLTRELDISCVQNPLVGTNLEALEHAEPQVNGTRSAAPRRVLVIGAGVGGAETARVLAAKGHEVEIWEASDRIGGQMALATAAPHKEDVQAVWTYRYEQLVTLGVPIRTGVRVDADAIRAFAPALVVVATGGRPRIPAAFAAVPGALRAWDVLLDPSLVAAGTRATIVGGGMVGAETAELLASRGCTVTIVEMLATVAAEMPRNNRLDITLRLRELGVTFVTQARVESIADGQIVADVAGERRIIEIGDALVLATGVEADRDVVPLVIESGVPYVLVGDANVPGDFLTVLRDAWLTALSFDFLPAKHPSLVS